MLTVDGQSRRFARLEAPPGAEQKLDELCRVAGASRPELLWCESLGGKGGVSGGGMIAVGVRDQLRNADRVARETGCDLGAAQRAAIEITIAHELGHAALHERGIDHEEDDADAWALSACELAGWRTPLHDVVTKVVKENRVANRARKNAFVDGAPLALVDRASLALGQAACSIAAVRGIEKTTPNFRGKLVQIANRLGTNVDWLAAIISFETKGTFSPSIPNPISGCIGLIQFCDPVRSVGKTRAELAAMTAEQQLDYVEIYFKRQGGLGSSLCTLYAAVFAPNCKGQSPDFVAYSRDDPTHPEYYTQNSKLDTDNDGRITCREVCAAVQGVLSSAGSRRVDAPCTPVVGAPPTGGGIGIGTLLVGAAIVGAAITYPYWRGVLAA